MFNTYPFDPLGADEVDPFTGEPIPPDQAMAQQMPQQMPQEQMPPTTFPATPFQAVPDIANEMVGPVPAPAAAMQAPQQNPYPMGQNFMGPQVAPGFERPEPFDVTQEEGYVNPKHAMWGGILQDLGQWLGSNGQSPLRGLGFQYMQAANEGNRRLRQMHDTRTEAESRRKDWLGVETAKLLYGEDGVAATEAKIGKLNPGLYTPDSVSKFEESGDYKDLEFKPESQSALEREFKLWREDPANADRPIGDFYGDRASLIAGGRKTGELDASTRHNTLIGGNEILMSNNRAREEMRGLRSELASVDTGQIKGRVKSFYDERYQALRSSIMLASLQNIATLSNMGVRLNPITQEELKVLMSTMPEMTNNPEANLKIIDRQIAKLERLNSDIESQIAFARNTNRPMTEYEVEPYDWSGLDGGASPATSKPQSAPANKPLINPEPIAE
jgi:hypothetical protein